ncbi:MAG TPA: YraN family protein [Chitinophagaceae bacterium]|nr:YraN family protein [Chitinophagaceae bacterium]
MSRNKNLGKKGEDMAADFLIKNGYHILERNWRSGHLEIDIIASHEQTLIFIEVKTRNTNKNGMPEESISESKIQSVTSAALKYLEGKKILRIRFDVISIRLHTQPEPEIFHIRDAFH